MRLPIALRLPCPLRPPRRMAPHGLASVALAGLLAAGLPQPAVAQALPANPAAPAAAPAAPDDSLFRAWAGRAGIQAVMDDFFTRLQADPRTGPHFKDAGRKHLVQQLTDQLCQLAGGPCVYDGPTMVEAHRAMDIGKADFHALVEVLQQSMDAKGIAFGAQNRMLALLAPMHRDIITRR